ncbi:RecD-like DNA helicase [Ruegeria phage RpAliso]|nr:RecD-like DNA helicase [Ruegeria phage RpAliso]
MEAQVTPTLTDHQWGATKQAAAWYREADLNRHLFETTALQDLGQLTSGDDIPTMLGQGQDFFFAGYAGTGKTTVLPAVIEECGLTPEEVAFCAPTGKAAKVMGEKLRAFGMRVTPTTIHKLIYLPKAERAGAIERRIKDINEAIFMAKAEKSPSVTFWDRDERRTVSIKDAEQRVQELGFDLIRAMDNDEGPRFSLRSLQDFDENIKLIVVDEGSMVGHGIANDLATFGRPILAFGDPGQLPPVQDHYGFNCEDPDTFLTEIHRQAKDNPIIHLATRARQGLDLKVGDYGNGVRVIERRDDDVTLDMEREAMVLCGTHKKKWNLTKKIRQALGYTETGPCEGEPLLFVKNSQKLEAMVNGTIVTCLSEHGNLRDGAADFALRIRDDDGGGAEYDIRVVQGIFEEHHKRKRNAYSAPPSLAFNAKKKFEQLDWGHVLTVHKSQGSQWDEVVLHDESGVFRESSHQWLYTGITRAAERLTVVV